MQIFDDVQTFLAECKDQGKPAIIAIVGPTASGKTALSLELAKAIDGEIISADSRQVYKYLDIGTDKIHESARQGVKHHLIDILEPDAEFTLADYKRMAIKAINDIHRRQKTPILCGGTGLYLNAIIENYQVPKVPPQYGLRQELARYYEQNGAEALHKLLQEKDPEAAARIHPNNVTYVIRAIEINVAGGHQKQPAKGETDFEVFTIGIDWPREILYDRINGRVNEIMDKGLLNEVKTLLMRGYKPNMPSMSSIGYQELIEFLQGSGTLEEAVDKIKQNTRNYCKRQLTWFRRYKNIHWLEGSELESYLTKPKA